MAILNTFTKNNRKVEIDKEGDVCSVIAINEAKNQTNNEPSKYVVDLREYALDRQGLMNIYRMAQNEVRQKVANRCITARKEAGLSQSELSRIIGINSAFISQIETNKYAPSQKILKSLADVSGHSVDYLLGKVDEDETLQLCSGESVERATAIAKMYLKSNLSAAEFKGKIKTIFAFMDELSIDKPLDLLRA